MSIGQLAPDLNEPSGMKRILKLIDDKFEAVLIVIGFLIFTLLINAQVINRYVLSFVEIGNITTWTEEMARYIFIFISYLGASLAIKQQANIKIDAIINNTPATI